MSGEYPCNMCKAKDKASGCYGCILDEHDLTCFNHDCLYQYEDCCELGFGKKCKVSTEYEDDYRDHTCNECVHWKEKPDKSGGMMNYCDINDDPHCDYDEACEEFEEAART